MLRAGPREQAQLLAWLSEHAPSHIAQTGQALVFKLGLVGGQIDRLLERMERSSNAPMAAKGAAKGIGGRRKNTPEVEAAFSGMTSPPKVASLDGEEWRQVADWPGRFWVSSFGRVSGRQGLRKPRKAHFGPGLSVWLSDKQSNKRSERSVGVLVLSAFVEPHGRTHRVGYRDGDPTNVRLENLFWQKCDPIRRKVGPRPFEEENHRRALSELPAWRAANDALKAGLPGHIRDDVIQDMLLAHLNGELEIAEMGARADEFRKAHNRSFGRRDQSLDALVPGTDNLRRIELLSDEEYRERTG